MPHRIYIANVKDSVEWPPIGYYVGRSVPKLEAVGITAAALGNPFRLQQENEQARADCLELYRRWLNERIQAGDDGVLWELNHLVTQACRLDIKLLCWCAPKACHSEVIATVIQQMQQMGGLSVSTIIVEGRPLPHAQAALLQT